MEPVKNDSVTLHGDDDLTIYRKPTTTTTKNLLQKTDQTENRQWLSVTDSQHSTLTVAGSSPAGSTLGLGGCPRTSRHVADIAHRCTRSTVHSTASTAAQGVAAASTMSWAAARVQLAPPTTAMLASASV